MNSVDKVKDILARIAKLGPVLVSEPLVLASYLAVLRKELLDIHDSDRMSEFDALRKPVAKEGK